MVRAIAGHGKLMHRLPETWFPWISWPCSSINTGWIPGNGNVANAGFVGVTNGIGVIIMPPVSVCHQVSMIGQRFLPTWLLYQCQASSLIGSPTEPITFSVDRSYFSTQSILSFASERMAVGAV